MGNHQGRASGGTWRMRVMLVLCAVTLQVGRAAADDEAGARLLADPFDYTEVADAFDGDDLFDLKVRLGFERATTTGNVERETTADADAERRSRRVVVARNETERSTLWLGLEAGLFHDLMVYGRIPLVLSETQSLTLADSARCGTVACDEVDALLRDVPEDALADSHRLLVLDPTFTSATRSGVPHVDLGLAWGVLPAHGEDRGPTWVWLLEARLPVGDVMRPCAADGGCQAGISRGTTRLKLETRFSYRVRHLEPYMGLSHAIEWATRAEDRFEPGGDVPDEVDAAPPSRSEATLGLVLVPWEERGRSQRFGIDLRGIAGYVSGGRDYTPLFDALGVSTSPRLGARFTGLTQVEPHARLGLEIGAVMQAAQYVQFRLGWSVAHQTAHLWTGAGACDAAMGACTQSPFYASVVDQPGRRFRSGGQWTMGLSALAVGQF
jgi:hypothetical protein